MFKLYIDGIDYTEDVLNLDEFTINIGFNDTSTITKGLSESVIVEGEAFLLLEKTFFHGCNSYTKELNAMFVADVCSSINIPLKINIDGLRYDPANGQMEILLKSITDEDKAYNILDSSFWHENGFESAYKIPLMYFIEQPNYIQWAILISTLSLRIVFNVIDLMIKWACKITLVGFIFDCPDDYNSAIFKLFDNWLLGVGNWGTAPLIREIIEYQCGHAGISFSSSIINDPASEYFNMAMFSLDTGDHGTHKETSDNKRKAVLKNNANLMTVIELLEGLKTTFEGTDYRIIDKVLYFEKTEYFDQIASIKILDVIGNCEITAPKYEYDLNELVAWGQFQFIQDSFDAEGNKSSGYYKINKDFNDPYSSVQKGSLQRLIPFAPASFQFDQRSYYKSFGNITGVWDAIKDHFTNWELMLDSFRSQIIESLTGLDWFGTEGLVRENDIVLTGKMTSVPKLLILEDNFNRNDAKVIKKLLKQQGLVKFYVYNYPLMYKEKVDEVDKNGNYTEAIEGQFAAWTLRADPRQKDDNIKIGSITSECSCDAIQDILLNFQKIYIATHKGKGIPRNTSIKIGKTKVEITYNNIRVLCSN